MPFRASFDCLWCGTHHATRSPDDLEGWAGLCPACIGKAGDNGFLRARLRQGLRDRAAAAGGPDRSPTVTPTSPSRHTAPAEGMATGPGPDEAASAADVDDWYLRRGRFARGAIHDAAWHAEVDAAGRWLDGLPWQGRLVELAAATGWWSPLLASRAELSMFDADSAPLDRARDRLVAHGLRAHLHVRDAWSEPDEGVGGPASADGLFTGFWLGRLDDARLMAFLALVRRWLRPGGRYAFIDALADPASGTADRPPGQGDGVHDRAGGDRKVPGPAPQRGMAAYRTALEQAGFVDVSVSTTGRSFVLGTGREPG